MPRSPSTSSPAAPRTQAGGGFGSGFLTGIMPLAPIAVIVVVALILAALARLLMAGQGFATEQLVAVLIIALGLLGSVVAYIVGCRRALRQVRRWQEAGAAARANGALWGLVVVALVVLLPLLLAILIPQHPAPTLTH